jgi:hypothetical protein
MNKLNEIQQKLNELNQSGKIKYDIYSELFDLAESHVSKEEAQLSYAEQQIYGFYSCYMGDSLTNLLNSMGLTKEEGKKLINEGYVDYLSIELKDELINYINGDPEPDYDVDPRCRGFEK